MMSRLHFDYFHSLGALRVLRATIDRRGAQRALLLALALGWTGCEEQPPEHSWGWLVDAGASKPDSGVLSAPPPSSAGAGGASGGASGGAAGRAGGAAGAYDGAVPAAAAAGTAPGAGVDSGMVAGFSAARADGGVLLLDASASDAAGAPPETDAAALRMASLDAGDDAGVPVRSDLGRGDGMDVVTIGDSYMNLIFSGIELSLERISGRDYRNYAFPGSLMLNGDIPQQYAAAHADDSDIKTVVMSGGGDDLLTSSCSDSCAPIVDALATRLDALLRQMAADGVQDVILVGYGYPADAARRAALDHARMLLPTHCMQSGTPRCHFIDPVAQLAGEIGPDGVHPTNEGYDILAKLVWEVMQVEGVRR